MFSSGKYMHAAIKSAFKLFFYKLNRPGSRHLLKYLNNFCGFFFSFKFSNFKTSCCALKTCIPSHVRLATWIKSIFLCAYSCSITGSIDCFCHSISFEFQVKFLVFLLSSTQYDFHPLFLINNFCIALKYVFST